MLIDSNELINEIISFIFFCFYLNELCFCLNNLLIYTCQYSKIFTKLILLILNSIVLFILDTDLFLHFYYIFILLINFLLATFFNNTKIHIINKFI